MVAHLRAVCRASLVLIALLVGSAPIAAEAATGCEIINAGFTIQQTLRGPFGFSTTAKATETVNGVPVAGYSMVRTANEPVDLISGQSTWKPNDTTTYTFTPGDVIQLSAFAPPAAPGATFAMRVSENGVRRLLPITLGPDGRGTVYYTVVASTTAVGSVIRISSDTNVEMGGQVTSSCTPAPPPTPVLQPFTHNEPSIGNVLPALTIDVPAETTVTGPTTAYQVGKTANGTFAVTPIPSNANATISVTRAGVITWTPSSNISSDSFYVRALNGTQISTPVLVQVRAVPAHGPSAALSVSPSTATVNQIATLTLTLTNPNPNVLLSNVSADVSFETINGIGAIINDGCGGGQTASQNGILRVRAGTLVGGSNCTISVEAHGTFAANFNIQAYQLSATGFNAGSTIDAQTVLHVVDPPRTTTALVSSANPQTFGQPVTFTATVTSATSGAVRFTDDGTDIAGCSSVTVSGAGVATCTAPSLASGNHPIVANFLGNVSFAASTSATLTQAIEAPSQPIDQTWVGGEGDDGNACSREAPCQTFARALAMTNAGGTITCLTPGGFGPVRIDKSVTIRCRGASGGIIASATSAISVAAPSNAAVVIDGLTLEGLSRTNGTPGTYGIIFVSGASLTVRNTAIHGFGTYGIAFTPGGNASLTLLNVTVDDNGDALRADSGGIVVRPSSAGAVVQVAVADSRVRGNGGVGIRLDGLGAAGVVVTSQMTRVTLSANGIVALIAKGGPSSTVLASFSGGAITGSPNAVLTNGTTSRILISRSAIHGNGVGLLAGSGGSNVSGGGNFVSGNGTDGTFTATAAPR